MHQPAVFAFFTKKFVKKIRGSGITGRGRHRHPTSSLSARWTSPGRQADRRKVLALKRLLSKTDTRLAPTAQAAESTTRDPYSHEALARRMKGRIDRWMMASR